MSDDAPADPVPSLDDEHPCGSCGLLVFYNRADMHAPTCDVRGELALTDKMLRSMIPVMMTATRGGATLPVDVDASSSWAPVDIGPILAGGTVASEKPTIGRRFDGQPLLYRGRSHTVASEPASGKTWFVGACVVYPTLSGDGGGRVVWVEFEETDPAHNVRRLLDVGLQPEHLGPDRFRVARPYEPYKAGEFTALLTWPDGGVADLVVLEGVTNGMTLFGLDPLGTKDTAVWQRTMVDPALALGCATIATDHVPKGKDRNVRFALGAQNKLGTLNGVAFVLERVTPFRQGSKGRTRVLTAKDRPGGLDPHGVPRSDSLVHIGDLVGDGTVEGQPTLWTLYPPDPEEAAKHADTKAAADRKKVLDRLRAFGEEKTMTALRTGSGLRAADVPGILDWLEINGCVGKLGNKYTYIKEPVSWTDDE